MSKRIGPMAWGSQGQVFLGEDLMHTRDYSDETARIIDEEVERILREQEDRCRDTLERFRPALDAVASTLLEKETIDGAEVHRIITDVMGEAPPAKVRYRTADEDELSGAGSVVADVADGSPDLLG
jgi:cell division protease FtsH